MKITKMALSAALAATCLSGSIFAQTDETGSDYGYYSSDAAPVASSASLSDYTPASAADYSAVVPAAAQCGCTDTPVSDCCDLGDSCCDGGCDSACGGGAGLAGLFGGLDGIDVGGWAQIGYHTSNNALFNQHADNVNLHQAWLYAEKVADGSSGIGLGGRIDYVYGVDAQDTQAFGIANNHWDNGWDNGIYGHSIPQLYAEVAAGDLSVKVGHFYTLIGWEVVGATGNFFYSHSHTMYNSEPFTHTGVLGQYAASDALTLYGGWVMGWDSGFEDNGDAFLGGYSADITDTTNITNQFVIGNFGEGAADETGFMSSFIATTDLTDDVQHVFWVDYLDTDNGNGNARQRETFDINNYLLVTLADNLVWGQRFEWYYVDQGVYGIAGANQSDFYAYTSGLNVSLSDNLMIRPEVRWDWNPDRVAGPTETDAMTGVTRATQTTFGMDGIITF